MSDSSNIKMVGDQDNMRCLKACSSSDWDKVLDSYISQLDAKPNTIKQYKKSLEMFFSWCVGNSISPNMVQKASIMSYRSELLEGTRRLSSQTVAAYIVAIRRFYEWAESEKLYPNVAKGIKSPRIKKDFVKMHLSAEQCAEVLEKLYEDIDNKKNARTYTNVKANALRDYALVNLLLRTGIRTIELSRLDVGDITTRRGRKVLLVWGKGRDSKDDFVPLSAKAIAPLEEYLQTRPDADASEPLFTCEGYGAEGRRMSTRRIQAICKDALRSIGLDEHEYSAHSFRHTCAVTLIKSGASAYDVQKFLRHSSINTTEIYLKSIEEELRLEKAPEVMLDKSF